MREVLNKICVQYLLLLILDLLILGLVGERRQETLITFFFVLIKQDIVIKLLPESLMLVYLRNSPH